MNCKPNDLAYVVVPPGFKPLLDKKFVTVHEHDVDDMTPIFTREKAARYPHKLWFCVFQTPFPLEGRTIRGSYLLDSWLRPIRDLPGDDETLEWAPVPHELETA